MFYFHQTGKKTQVNNNLKSFILTNQIAKLLKSIVIRTITFLKQPSCVLDFQITGKENQLQKKLNPDFCKSEIKP